MAHSLSVRTAGWLVTGAVVLVWAQALGVGDALAGTITGTAVTVGGLDNLAATIQSYSKGNLGKFVGIILGIAGMAGIAAGRPGVGAGAAAAGVGMAFLPNIMGTAFDATQAAPLVGSLSVATPLQTWWAPLLGVLYPVALSVKLALDPVFVCCQALVVLASWRRRRLA